MNKNDIKTKWGQYTDTDKLVDNMMALLTKYGHRNTEHGVCCVLDTFFENKKSLIELLQKSDNYTGDLRIVLDEDIERRCDSNELHRFINNFPSAVGAGDCIRQKIDAHGKTVADYYKINKMKVSVADLESAEFLAATTQRAAALSMFNLNGVTCESERKYDNFLDTIGNFKYISTPTIPDGVVEDLAKYNVHKGAKTSRAFNKICQHFGVDKSQVTVTNSRGLKQRVYDIEFAKYSDMVSGAKRSIKFFISVNPLDYLTMSFGVNWASCHTIDKNNIRNMANHYSGSYCGGTMSYMLDSTSMITYVHDTMPENYETGKVYRNMFHLGGDGVLLQNRVYPQGNDGCTDLYQEFRSIVQREMAKLLGLNENLWTKKKSVTLVNSLGCHYKDYNCNNNCVISYPTERPQCKLQEITIGHDRICTYCGEVIEVGSASYLAHGIC